ncbi:MAG: alpha/beta hydrolase [Candidatus Limnocylindrales bacterium]
MLQDHSHRRFPRAVGGPIAEVGMPEIRNHECTISYETAGQGRPLVLLHGWSGDRTLWAPYGYVEGLCRDHRVVMIDLRGHGQSDKPHDWRAYRAELTVADVLAVADAEGLDRFAIWGFSYGGWIGWMTAAAAPDRVGALITTGSWDPRPGTDADWQEFDDSWGAIIRREGMQGLIEHWRQDDGPSHDREFPAFAESVTLRADPAALLAIQARELVTEGVGDVHALRTPVLLIAGELEDPEDEAAMMAGLVPNGASLRLPGLGHGGAAGASALAIPTARTFLDRWFDRPADVTAAG